MRDLAAQWNRTAPVSVLPPEVLASCFTFLPFRDRITASHVSRSWRHIALEHPAVWAQIDICPDAPEQLALIKMALERSGQHVVDFKYHRHSIWKSWTVMGEEDYRPEIAAAVEPHLHRMRSIEWNSTDGLNLDQPLARLESLNANLVFLSPRCLTGLLDTDRLHTLHIPINDFPGEFPSPMCSVRDFACDLSNASSSRAMLPGFFELFPHMEVFTLRGLDSPIPLLPAGPPPRSLIRLRLFAAMADAKDLVEQAIVWDTPQLREVELRFNPLSFRSNSSVLRVHQFLRDSVELVIGPRKNHRLCATAKTARGRTLVISFQREPYADMGDAKVAHFTAQALWSSVSDACMLLTSVTVSVDELECLKGAGGRFPAAHTLVVTFERVHEESSHRHAATLRHTECYYPWPSLIVLEHVSSRFPALCAFFLELDGCRGEFTAAGEDVDDLFENLPLYGVSGLPVLHVRGISPDVVRDIDPQRIQELPMKIEFDLQ